MNEQSEPYTLNDAPLILSERHGDTLDELKARIAELESEKARIANIAGRLAALQREQLIAARQSRKRLVLMVKKAKLSSWNAWARGWNARSVGKRVDENPFVMQSGEARRHLAWYNGWSCCDDTMTVAGHKVLVGENARLRVVVEAAREFVTVANGVPLRHDEKYHNDVLRIYEKASALRDALAALEGKGRSGE